MVNLLHERGKRIGRGEDPRSGRRGDQHGARAAGERALQTLCGDQGRFPPHLFQCARAAEESEKARPGPAEESIAGEASGQVFRIKAQDLVADRMAVARVDGVHVGDDKDGGENGSPLMDDFRQTLLGLCGTQEAGCGILGAGRCRTGHLLDGGLEALNGAPSLFALAQGLFAQPLEAFGEAQFGEPDVFDGLRFLQLPFDVLEPQDGAFGSLAQSGNGLIEQRDDRLKLDAALAGKPGGPAVVLLERFQRGAAQEMKPRCGGCSATASSMALRSRQNLS